MFSYTHHKILLISRKTLANMVNRVPLYCIVFWCGHYMLIWGSWRLSLCCLGVGLWHLTKQNESNQTYTNQICKTLQTQSCWYMIILLVSFGLYTGIWIILIIFVYKQFERKLAIEANEKKRQHSLLKVRLWFIAIFQLIIWCHNPLITCTWT